MSLPFWFIWQFTDYKILFQSFSEIFSVYRIALMCPAEKNPVDNFFYGKKINSASHNEIADFL